MRRGVLVVVALAACEINPAFDPLAGASSTTSTGTGTTSMSSTGGTSSGTTGEATGSSGTTDNIGEPLGDVCPRLPPPTGEIITVGPDQAADLQGIVFDAPAGSTVELLPGTYDLAGGLHTETESVTLRSSTGNPEDVELVGGPDVTSIFLVQASDVTIAEMTLRGAGSSGHLIHVSGRGTTDVLGVTGYRLHLIDPMLGAFKVNRSASGGVADDGTVACSTITLTDEGRAAQPAECTAAGVLGFGVAGWHVRDNVIEGFWCSTDFNRAIAFSEGSADHVIERNKIIDSSMGIQLGVYENPTKGIRTYDDRPGCDDGFYDHYGGLVRNNMIVVSGTGIAASDVGFDSGILLWQVCGTTVVHNTVVSAIGAMSSIEYRFTRTQAKVVNNLVTDEIIDRNEAGVPVAGNLQMADLNNFVDPLGADVHLVSTSEAIDAGVMLGEDTAHHDFDGDPRIGPPDIGADEI